MLIRRELEEAAKVLGERTRTGEATSEVRLLVSWAVWLINWLVGWEVGWLAVGDGWWAAAA